MGRRSRRRGGADVKAPSVDYVDADGNTLTLRGALSPGARVKHEQERGASPLSREDARERAFELLFEHRLWDWQCVVVALVEPAAFFDLEWLNLGLREKRQMILRRGVRTFEAWNAVPKPAHKFVSSPFSGDAAQPS